MSEDRKDRHGEIIFLAPSYYSAMADRIRDLAAEHDRTRTVLAGVERSRAYFVRMTMDLWSERNQLTKQIEDRRKLRPVLGGMHAMSVGFLVAGLLGMLGSYDITSMITGCVLLMLNASQAIGFLAPDSRLYRWIVRIGSTPIRLRRKR